MAARHASLRQQPDFFNSALRVTSPWGVLYAKQAKNSSDEWLSIITPKKNFPRAVDRNRAKRRVKAVLFPLLANLQLALIPNRRLIGLSYQDLKKTLQDWLAQV